MSTKPNRGRRGAALLNFLFSYGKLAAVPALIVGLLTLGNVTQADGVSPRRLGILAVCALVVAACALVEKNEARIRRYFDRKRSEAPSAAYDKSVQPAAAPAEPVPETPTPAEPDSAGSKWRIGWTSGVLDDIGLVYEKAGADPVAAGMLSRLEDQALDEARQRCDMISAPGEKLTPEAYDGMAPEDRETVIVLLGEKGIQSKNTDVANRQITVTLSPVIQCVMGCAVFRLLNWLEKLDGALNELVEGKVTLEFVVPLGGRKGLVQWEMLILRLYPWLSIRETATNVVATAPSAGKQAGGTAQAEPPAQARAEAQARPSGAAPASGGADPALEAAVSSLRQKIIRQIAQKPAETYELASLLWGDAAKCFPGGKGWDGAWFNLDLNTGGLSAHVSTYPNQFGASYDSTFTLDAAEFHRIATEFHFQQELQRFETDADWARLFDDALKAAVAQALKEVRRQAAEQEAQQREKYAVRIPASAAPKLNIKRVLLELNQRYGCSRLTLTREQGTYLIRSDHTYTSSTNNSSHSRKALPAEAAWIEDRVARAIADPDASTWHSLPGGDTMVIEIDRAEGKGVALRNVTPIRKYSNLLNDLEKLAQYGSRAAD